MARNAFAKGRRNPNYKHGASSHPLFTVWISMKRRCNDASCKSYPHYGGRGITYEPRWESFQDFLNDMERSYRSGLTLDRIDVNGNYCKANCRFVDRKQQANNRTNTRLFEYTGQANTLTNWAAELGIKRSTLAQRIYVYKWPLEKALQTP